MAQWGCNAHAPNPTMTPLETTVVVGRAAHSTRPPAQHGHRRTTARQGSRSADGRDERGPHTQTFKPSNRAEAPRHDQPRAKPPAALQLGTRCPAAGAGKTGLPGCSVGGPAPLPQHARDPHQRVHVGSPQPPDVSIISHDREVIADNGIIWPNPQTSSAAAAARAPRLPPLGARATFSLWPAAAPPTTRRRPPTKVTSLRLPIPPDDEGPAVRSGNASPPRRPKDSPVSAAHTPIVIVKRGPYRCLSTLYEVSVNLVHALSANEQQL